MISFAHRSLYRFRLIVTESQIVMNSHICMHGTPSEGLQYSVLHECDGHQLPCLISHDTCEWPAVKQCDNPTEEEADKVHALLVEAIVQLYERYRHLIPGWESRPLIIE